MELYGIVVNSTAMLRFLVSWAHVWWKLLISFPSLFRPLSACVWKNSPRNNDRL